LNMAVSHRSIRLDAAVVYTSPPGARIHGRRRLCLMKTSTRSMMIIPLALALSGTAWAQETARTTTRTDASRAATSTAATGTAATATAATDSSTIAAPDADETSEARQTVRQEFSQLLARHPDAMTRVIVLDPTLLSNEPFLAKYPELAQFVAQHPEIRRNPHFYLRDHEEERVPFRPRSAAAEVAEMISMVFVTAVIASAIIWLVRTIIDQKRWSQLSRRQSEVHTKILDRLSSSEELLGYIKSPAGTKYLESAPIALHVAPPAPATRASRVMLSIQIGIVVAAAGLGLLLVSARSTGDAEQGFFAMGAVAFCIGGGFILSALVSSVMARRLGLSNAGADALHGTVADEPGTMR
jgi:hypothetical protein